MTHDVNGFTQNKTEMKTFIKIKTYTQANEIGKLKSLPKIQDDEMHLLNSSLDLLITFL